MKDIVLERKQAVVTEILDYMKDAKAIVLAEYRGLTVADATELRAKCREANIVYKVYKNTMLSRAFKEAGAEEMEENLVGPNAIAFSMNDEVTAAKVLKDFAEKNDKLVIKAGYVDGTVIDAEGVKNLATIPSKETLISMALSGLNAPITGLAMVSQGLLRNVVYALNAIAEKKEQEVA